ncbi:MAG: phasin family protein [Desulfobacterales bacterium]|nr:phasin family protein [Desulfobacterales bacterium]
MIDQLKKTMSTGIDFALKTKEEVEDFVKDLVSKSKISDIEGKQIREDFLKKYDETKEKLESFVEKRVNDVLKKMNVARADEVEQLKAEIASLKEALDKK